MTLLSDGAVLAIESQRLKVLSLMDSGKERLGRWRRDRDQRTLERDLAKIITTANGHAAKNVPKGALVYIALRDTANGKINDFCQKWEIDRLRIDAVAPALKDLDDLCAPDKAVNPGIKLIGILFGLGFSLVLIGMASGLITFGHQLIVNHLPH